MRVAVLVFLLLASYGAVAMPQTETADTQPPSKENVQKFMALLHLKEQLTQYFAGIARQTKLGAEQGFKQQVPNATPEQLAAVDEFADQLFKDMPVDEMLEAMVPVYQKHLTKGDLDAILAFYSSPVGQKLLKEQPAMMQEAMQVGGEIGRQRMGSMMQRMHEFTAKLAQDQKKNPPESPKN